ncbi:hypothetical protein ACFYZ9_34365 [Streptomyces sp. NPDC001691]|uniref:hypothetical protein n=1 Tax=Streptomyces sp. NPDC001691 TaxID=3364600 RepID=UPI0036740FA0
MRELLEKIETRHRLVRETAEQLRDQIARLTEQLTAAEETLNRLETTRELTAENGTPTPEPLPTGYREILALFEQAGEGLRARDVSRAALGLGPEPRHTENTRAKLKRLVNRDILIEPEPGLFTLAKAAPGAPEANSN